MTKRIRELGSALAALIRQRDELGVEISAAAQHEDYSLLGTCNMQQSRIIQQIADVRRNLGDAVIAWIEVTDVVDE